MKALVITANPKDRGALATLTTEVVRGITDGGVEVEEIRLAERDIRWCNFCFKCVRDPVSEIGPCSQDDDMTGVLEKARDADGYVFATQLSSIHANARWKTFQERATYMAGRDSTVLFIKGYPVTRFKDKKRFAVTVVTAGGMPSWTAVICTAPRQLAETARLFNAKVVGRLFAGMIRNGMRPRDPEKAYRLGRRLAEEMNAGREGPPRPASDR